MIKIKAAQISLFVAGIVLLYGYLLGSAQAASEGQVQMSVSVVARKATDTINDFIWNGQDNPLVPPKVVSGAYTDVSSATNQSQIISTQFHWQDLLFLSTIYDVYYVISRSRP